ncbi:MULTISPECIES: LysR family transcriptional regulator [Variovorax]|jgi:DNA-binding transcriptional LysR family regulator|uniref:LysR family transcriptional regulator n=1 Tax=Variovorax TaxID=34072 RepID=UPI000898BD0C|nr:MULTISPECIES: LysR family transcriptional regulator [Variovorax]MDQ0081763.1 DNA-binding transcriptional LysR family regulator [Variovorax boronicumulans]SDY44413.1 DNA-binding transcriptional regulator, LysR family [Variovorax sp. YR634]SDZ07035.1 DNA-binding transcriptional regulator, LysR family [Variovorax sp. YR266]SET44082.1 DNA-binding transcriptional regulator, LysR family [Variovorax sp. OV084]
MNYRSADLNLLKVFEALMTEGNVTRAASKLSLTQPAVSNALRRLRETFDDALFVRSGAGVNPTRRAIDLWEPLSQSLHAIRGTLDLERFDALRSTASLSIAMSDYVSGIVVPRLASKLSKAAPSMLIHAIPNTLVDFDKVLADNKADFAISVYNEEVQRPAFLKSRALWSPDFVCVMRTGHPLARADRIPLKKFLAARHVDVSLVGKTTPTYDLFLHSRGLQRNLVATVNHYGAAYEVVRRSDLIAVLPWSEKFEPARLAGLRRMPVPLEAPARVIELFWHQRHETSALHQWLKNTLLALFEQPS